MWEDERSPRFRDLRCRGFGVYGVCYHILAASTCDHVLHLHLRLNLVRRRLNKQSADELRLDGFDRAPIMKLKKRWHNPKPAKSDTRVEAQNPGTVPSFCPSNAQASPSGVLVRDIGGRDFMFPKKKWFLSI